MPKKQGTQHRVFKKNHNNQKSTRTRHGRPFAGSRLKELQDVADDLSSVQHDQGKKEEADDSSYGSSDDDSVGSDSVPVKPYRSLLHSLTGGNENARANDGLKPNQERTTKKSPAEALDSQKEFIDSDPDPLEGSESEESEADGVGSNEEDEPTQRRDAYHEHFTFSAGMNPKPHVKDGANSLSQSASMHLGNGWKSTWFRSQAAAATDNRLHRIPKTLSASDLSIKQRIRSKADPLFSSAKGIELYLAQIVFGYSDVLFCERQGIEADRLRRLMSLHALNHVLKTRDLVLKNNERQAAAREEPDDSNLCDQGWTRPKVLFLLPTRHSCFKMASLVVSMYGPEQQENKKRFEEAFGNRGDPISKGKPQDFHDLFEGNDDDLFRIGLKINRKTVKFFAPFYSADMIFASPLGLRMAIGSPSSDKYDADFLSSIEVVVVDQTDALLMQNWEHVEYIYEHLNRRPRSMQHTSDISRIRWWYLEEQAESIRQNIVLTSFNTPEINSLFNSRMLNYAGRTKVAIAAHDGLIGAPNALFKQTFYRFQAATPVAEPDARFAYFTAKIVPRIVKRARENPGRAQGIFIFIPSYLDFVRVRNFFENERDLSFGSMCEYTAAPDVARARSHFIKGRHDIVLYTGRLHHFRRYQVKGAKQVVFYGLPDSPVFYKELASDFPALGVAAGKVDETEISVQVLYSRFDALRLERIVGTERMATMLGKSAGDVIEFMP